MMKPLCRVLGHRWVFTHITIPRQFVCSRCGTRPKANRDAAAAALHNKEETQ